MPRNFAKDLIGCVCLFGSIYGWLCIIPLVQYVY